MRSNVWVGLVVAALAGIAAGVATSYLQGVLLGASLATIAIVRYGQSAKQRAAGAAVTLLVAGAIFILYGLDRYWALLW